MIEIEDLKIRYAQFVNRKSEIDHFCEILSEDKHSVMLVSGEPGMGKTALHKRLLYECLEVKKVRWAETFWINTRDYSYLAILRKIREDIGEIHFQHFTDLVNFFTQQKYELTLNVQNAGSINVGDGLIAENSEIENMIGQQIIIKDLNLTEPRQDRTIREQERMYRLTQEFISDLEKALNGDQLVILIDDLEKMPPDTGKWVWSELIRGVMLKGLRNVRFVLCIDNEPSLDDEDLSRKVRTGKLQPLTETYVFDYLTRREVGETEATRKAVAEMIFAETNGKPSGVASMVKTLLELQKKKLEAADND